MGICGVACNVTGVTVRCVTCTNVSPPSWESPSIKGPFYKSLSIFHWWEHNVTLRCWCFFDAVNKISICGVAVISNLTVCDGDGVSSPFLAAMGCLLIFFAVLRCSAPPTHVPLIKEVTWFKHFNPMKLQPVRFFLSLVSMSLYLSYLSCLSYEKNSSDRHNFMETSRTNAQYKRNDRYNLLYEIEWILSVLWFFFRTTDTTIWKPGFNLDASLTKITPDWMKFGICMGDHLWRQHGLTHWLREWLFDICNHNALIYFFS